MSTDHLTQLLLTAPDAELFDAARRATFELLMTPAGTERVVLYVRGAYPASWFAARETGREALWREAVEAGREDVREHDRQNWLRAQEINSRGKEETQEAAAP